MDLDGDYLRAFGAFFTGVGAILAGWAAISRAKNEGKKECEEEKKEIVDEVVSNASLS